MKLLFGINPPVLDESKKDDIKKDEDEVKEKEEEDSKIIVTIHDINSPTSSSDNLEKMNQV